MEKFFENINMIKELIGIKEDTSPDERNIRELIASEYEAVKSYEKFAVEAENERVKKVLTSIADEEKVHIGELEETLRQIGMSSDDSSSEGAKEVKDLIGENYFTEKDLKIKELEKDKNGAYHERDMLVAFLSKVFPSCLGRHEESDKEWDDNWRNIVYINSPNGQLSWHISEDELCLFSHLQYDPNVQWDGHTTEEKYSRLLGMESIREEKIEFGLSKQQYDKNFKGCSLGKDKDGYFVYTHRARSKSYDDPNKISEKDINFIDSTG